MADTNLLVSEWVMIPAFGILDFWVSPSLRVKLGSYFGLHGFSIMYMFWTSVSDLYGFPVIFMIENFEVKLGTGQRRNISGRHIGMMFNFIVYDRY